MRTFLKTIRPFIFQELFYFLASLLLVFIILEILFPNIILAYFNLNYLFLLLVFFGAIYLTENKQN